MHLRGFYEAIIHNLLKSLTLQLQYFVDRCRFRLVFTEGNLDFWFIGVKTEFAPFSGRLYADPYKMQR